MKVHELQQFLNNNPEYRDAEVIMAVPDTGETVAHYSTEGVEYDATKHEVIINVS